MHNFVKFDVSKVSKYLKVSDSNPPIASKYYFVNLKGQLSKPKPPGVALKMKARSM